LVRVTGGGDFIWRGSLGDQSKAKLFYSFYYIDASLETCRLESG
jgi:hypothetical protein